MFSEEEKLSLADLVIELYFSGNFGTITKSDFEVSLFSQYLENLRNNDEPYDDYSVSRDLGITRSRVRSLKERAELKRPYIRYHWQELFVNDLKSAKYDKDDHHVKFIVKEGEVLSEVRKYIEDEGWYDEYSLNRRLVNIPLSCFVDLFCSDSELDQYLSDDVNKTISKIAKNDSSMREFAGELSKDGLKCLLMSASKETLDLVLSKIPFQGTAKIAFELLRQAIGRA